MTGQSWKSHFNHWLRRARLQQGLTQVQLADQPGIDAKTIQRRENSPQTPRPYLLPKLAAVLGLLQQEKERIEPWPQLQWTH